MTITRRTGAIWITALAALAALMSVSFLPTETSVFHGADGRETLLWMSTNPLGSVIALAMLASSGLSVLALVLFRRQSSRIASRILIGAGAFGLLAVVPGLLAFLGRYLMVTSDHTPRA